MSILDTVSAASAAAEAAQAALEQAVRDARAGGATITSIATALGGYRQRVYAILDRDPSAPTRPAPVPVVYLRGAGVKAPAWDRIERAMWSRGWDTTHDRTTAWHLARGGVPLVLVDFSATRGDGAQARVVTVARLRARWDDESGDGPREMDLPIVAGGDHRRPYRRSDDGSWLLDEDAIAGWVRPLLTAKSR